MRYIGPIEVLKGKTALINGKAATDVMAQFDDLSLPHEYTHGWKCLPADHFEDV